MYAKLQNNTLQIAPKQVQWEGQTVINPGEDILLALCYLPVQYTDQPSVDDGYYAVSRWAQTETAIVQEWYILKDNRPLTVEEVTAMLLKQQVNTLDVDDTIALRMMEFYPAWSDIIGQTAEKAGYKFTYNGDLYKTIPANHTFAAQWVPGVGTESLYTRIDETHDGTLYDPIPYEGNMALVSGKYYSQYGVVYRCSRDTVNPVYNTLRELVGLYVEMV